MICWIIVNCSTQVKKLLVDSIIFHVSLIFFFFRLSRIICTRDDGDLWIFLNIFFPALTNLCSILCASCGGLTQFEGAVKFQNKVVVFWELVKNSLNLTSFPPIPLNFGGNENLKFWGNREGWVFPHNHYIPSYLNFQTRKLTFYSLH